MYIYMSQQIVKYCSELIVVAWLDNISYANA